MKDYFEELAPVNFNSTTLSISN